MDHDESTNATDYIKLLIEERLRKEKEFNEGSISKTTLWKSVHNNIILKDPNFPLDAEALKAKYYNLLTTYKRAKKRRSVSGNHRTLWPYYNMFEEVLGTQHMTEPSTENLSSTYNTNKKHKKLFTPESYRNSHNSYMFDHEYALSSIRNKRKRRKGDKTLKYFLKRIERKEEKRHQEYMEIEKRRLKVEKAKVETMQGISALLQNFISLVENDCQMYLHRNC